MKLLSKNDRCARTCSLQFRILASVFLVFALSLGIALYGMWTYQRDRIADLSREEARQAGLTIKAGLRHAMLKNDKEALRRTIDELIRFTDVAQISILDDDCTVRMSSDPALLGRLFNMFQSPSCTVCHKVEGKAPESDSVVINGEEGAVLRSVIKIPNQAECHSCHSPDKKILGVLMVDSSLADFLAILKTVSLRVFFTGMVTFAAIVVLISYIISRFVTGPLQALLVGFQRVGRGDFDYWVDVKGGGELAEMADSFNIMSRAIGRYINEIASKTEEITTLYSIVQRMSETIELKKLIVIVIDLLFETLKAQTVLLVMPAEDGDNLFEVNWKDSDDRRIQAARFDPATGGLPHEAIRRDILEQWQQHGIGAPHFVDNGRRAVIPIQLKDMRFALICVVKAPGESFTVPEKKLLPALVHHIAISFTNARLYTMAVTDELTGLYTKRYLQTASRQMVERVRQDKGSGFCLMMLDLDYFKEVNDRYGHQVGDRVLGQVADVIRASLRSADIPCRYGGEEFVVVLPGADIQTGRMIAERLRDAIAEHAFDGGEGVLLHKTVSIGLACYPAHATTIDDLITVADAALYSAKKDGRNRVYVCSESTARAEG